MNVETLLAELRADLAKVLAKAEGPAPLLSLADAAKQLADISVPTLKRMIARGEIFPVPLGGRLVIPRSEIERIARGEPSTRRLNNEAGKARSPRAKKVEARSTREAIRKAAKKLV